MIIRSFLGVKEYIRLFAKISRRKSPEVVSLRVGDLRSFASTPLFTFF